MPRHIRLEPHLAVDELARRYRAAKEPHERSWYQILWLLAQGQTAREIAVSTGYSPYWIGQIAKRYNAAGPAGMTNRQYTHSHRAQPLLSGEQLAELAEVVRGPAPEGDHWLGRTVAAWGGSLGRKPGEEAWGGSMRIGLIADIHGNLVALETVLAELAEEALDDLVCLGDVAALGPQPGAVLARLRTLGCPVVMGNMDAWLLALPTDAALDEIDLALARWHMDQLSDSDRAFIHAFPVVIERSLDAGRTLLCFHGSPSSYHDVIVPTTPDDALDVMLGEARAATILAGGHTHLQMLRRHGDAHLVNPGSVGLPGVGAAALKNHAVHWAEYAVVEAVGDRLVISLRRTPLDVERMVALAYASGMPAPALEWWVGLWDRA